MEENIRIEKLGNIASVKGGKRLPKGINLISTPNGHPYIRIKNLGTSKFLELNSEYEYVDTETQKSISQYIVASGDILISIVGTIGLVGIVGDSLDGANQTENCVKLIDLKGIDKNYLYYFLTSKLGQGEIKRGIVGAVQSKLPIKNILDINIPLPSLEKQKAVASILSLLDNKIELNRRINDNLEQQAQALFKAWFVDFEPFKDGKFVDSELGRIPEGWKILCADEIYNINIGKTPPRKESIWFSKTEDANIKWISISDLANCGTFIGNSSEYLTPQAINKFNIIVVPSDTVLLSFKLTIGRIAIAKCSLTTNEAIARFYLPNPTYREFTYLTLKNYDYSKLGSTSSIATAVNSKIIKNMKILFPNTKDIEKFHNTIQPIFDTIKSKSDEIDRLCELRDTLLPRLMSGELNINTITE